MSVAAVTSSNRDLSSLCHDNPDPGAHASRRRAEVHPERLLGGNAGHRSTPSMGCGNRFPRRRHLMRKRTPLVVTAATALGLGLALVPAGSASAKSTPDVACMKAGISVLKEVGLFSTVARGGLP